MYYQINVTMERKKYEEKPPVVVLDRICEQAFTTVNFGVEEVENGYEAFSTTLTGEKSAEDVLSWLDVCGMIGELKRQELEEIINKLECEDKEALVKKFDSMLNAEYSKEVAEKVRSLYMTLGIQKEINRFGLTAKEALAVKDMHPEWKPGIDVGEGDRYRCDGILWESLSDHKAQDNWRPSLATSSIWKTVEEEHSGSENDPIPYNPPMQIEAGKYYSQNGTVYKCTRDSGQPLTHNLSELVGIYVESIK